MLKHGLLQHYQRYGYAILPYKLHSSVINKLELELKEIQIESQRNKNIQYTDKYDLDHNGYLYKIKRPHQWSNIYKSLLYNPFIINIVSQFLDTDGIRYQGFKLNIKPPNNKGSSVMFHQDFAYYPHTNDHLCTISIPLIDININNGTLLYIPESHLGPIYSHHLNDEFIGCISCDDDNLNIDASNIEAVQCEKGSIIIHNSRIIHGSTINKSTQERPLLLIQYAANNSWPLQQNTKGSFGYDLPLNNNLDEWDLYQSTIISGEATYYPFMKNIPISLPLPWPNRSNFGSVYQQQNKNIDNNTDIIDEIVSKNKIKIVSVHDTEQCITSPPLEPEISSARQINFIYNLDNNKYDLWKRLTHFVGVGPFGLLNDTKYTDLRLKLENAFIAMCEKYVDDNMIYESLHNFYHENIMTDKRFEDELTQFNHYNDRVSKRSNEIVKILKFINKNEVKNILDIGCGDGLITIDIAKQLNINNPKMIHGHDIKKHNRINDEQMTFNDDISSMDIEYFDLITCLMSMHHIKHQKELLDKIYKLLKPNGILIIREHDCYMNEISVLLDIVHGLHCKVWSPKSHSNYQSDFTQNFKTYYQSHKQWNMSLTSSGFKKLGNSPIVLSKSELDVKNVFFGIYTRNTSINMPPLNTGTSELFGN